MNPPKCQNGGFLNFQCICKCPEGLEGDTCESVINVEGEFSMKKRKNILYKSLKTKYNLEIDIVRFKLDYQISRTV